MATTGVKVGSLDIQFGKEFDQAKANQLVQSLQQVIQAINRLANSATTPVTPPGVPVHVLATQAGLGVDHTVAGLVEGQVLVAESPTTAHFGFLAFAQLAQTDPATFDAPGNGYIIAFLDGYWSAIPNTLGLADPGSDAVIFWDTTANGGAGGLAWALPGTGIKFAPGSISVDTTQLIHGQLQGLLADDHPQYALVGTVPELGTVNVFTALQTFEVGLVSGGDIDLTGNLEQTGFEPEQRIINTDDIAGEGAWRLHVEPGQELWAAVNDPESDGSPGSDAEDFLYVQRIDDVVDTVGVQATSFTFNGFDVMVGDPIPGSAFFPVVVGGVRYNLLTTAVVLGGVPGSGTVTSVNLTSVLGTIATSGGPITGVGTFHVELPVMSGVAPGAYTNCNVTVDAYGRITLIANGTGGGSALVPATLGGLVYWVDGSLSAAAAPAIPLLGSPDMSRVPFGATGTNGGVPAGTALNSQRTLGFNGAAAAVYTFLFPALNLGKCTVFVVCRPNSFATYQSFLSGLSGAMNIQLVQTTGQVSLVSDTVAAIGTSTGVAVVGTALQFNTTYDVSTGNWAIRIARAPDSSGTNLQTITAVSDMIGANHQGLGGSPEYVNADVAELLVYNRVLSSGDIATVEAYLLAKWGV